MLLTSNDIARVASLSRLEISETENETIRRQLDAVFEMIAAIQAVDTQTVEPMTNAQEITQRLRPDQVSEQDQRTLFQSIAPEIEAGLYLVPQVIE